MILLSAIIFHWKNFFIREVKSNILILFGHNRCFLYCSWITGTEVWSLYTCLLYICCIDVSKQDQLYYIINYHRIFCIISNWNIYHQLLHRSQCLPLKLSAFDWQCNDFHGHTLELGLFVGFWPKFAVLYIWVFLFLTNESYMYASLIYNYISNEPVTRLEKSVSICCESKQMILFNMFIKLLYII